MAKEELLITVVGVTYRPYPRFQSLNMGEVEPDEILDNF